MVSRSALVVAIAGTVLLSGCATKNWVREMMGKQQVDTDSKIGEQKVRVEGMGFRVAKVEEDTAKIGERAEAAHTRVDAVDTRLTRLWTNRNVRQTADKVDIMFGFDKWNLDDGAQTALLGLVKELQSNRNLTVDLTGYTDPRGGVPYNVGLSQRRVESVRRFLVSKGVELPRIQSIGFGIADEQAPDAQKRRVTVQLMTPTE